MPSLGDNMANRSWPEAADASHARWLGWGAGLLALVCGVLLLGFGDNVTQLIRLFELERPANPYFVPQRAGLLYFCMPLVVLAAVILSMLPGLVLALNTAAVRGLCDWLLKGFVAGFYFNVIAASCVKLISGSFLSPLHFIATQSAGVMVGIMVLAARQRCGRVTPRLLCTALDRRRLSWVMLLPIAGVILLLPILFWQDFNPDGLEQMLLGRSLSEKLLPRLPGGELPGLGLGMIAEAYPVSWFIAVFGSNEPAARLPLMLFLPFLFAAIVCLIELCSERHLTWGEELALIFSLAAFVATLGYNDTYHPYSADISSPANIDILAVLLFIGMAYFLWSSQPSWFLAVSALGYLTRPTALMVLVLLGLGSLLSVHGRRSRIIWAGAVLVLCFAVAAIYERGVVPLLGNIEEESGEIRHRLRYLRWDDFQRLLFLVVPSGILPALSLFMMRFQDAISRSLTFLTVAYFAFFYFVAFIALHHFAPVMVLPIIVYWRILINWRPQGLIVATSMLAAVCAIYLSLPRRWDIDRRMRAIGYSSEYRVGNYKGSFHEAWEALRGRWVVNHLFRPHYSVADPSRELISAPAVQLHYSSLRPTGSFINYIVQPVSAPSPEGFTFVGENPWLSVWVKDFERWQRDRFGSFPIDFRSPLYHIPKETLFRHWGAPAGNYNIDLTVLLRQVWKPKARAAEQSISSSHLAWRSPAIDQRARDNLEPAAWGYSLNDPNRPVSEALRDQAAAFRTQVARINRGVGTKSGIVEYNGGGVVPVFLFADEHQ